MDTKVHINGFFPLFLFLFSRLTRSCRGGGGVADRPKRFERAWPERHFSHFVAGSGHV